MKAARKSFETAHAGATDARARSELPERIRGIHRDLAAARPHLCPERAVLVTEYFRKYDAPGEPAVVRQARVLHHLLTRKSVRIYPGELIVGNAGTSRVSCILQPELASAFMASELAWIERRRTNPFRISRIDRARLATRVIPYWLRRSMPARMFPDPLTAARYVRSQLDPVFYLINEAGGIGHFLPDYARMLRLGTRGYLESLAGQNDPLHQAAGIVLRGLEKWAERIAEHASGLARDSVDRVRRAELVEIARICRKVPREPAETFHEALQSLWLTHLAVNLESINSAVSFGRIDQYLYPYYQRDLERGVLARERALELLLCFSAKATEHLFLLSSRISEYHAGYLVVQAAVVGGMDREGRDAVNPLTWLLLEIMEKHRMRDPNYQVRVHRGSPPDYLARAADVARQGSGMPAFFNDEAVVAALTAHGFPPQDARDYGIVGCVEPSIPGKSFLSTDAALFNLPICLELALNGGRRWNDRRRSGAPTPDPAGFRSMDDILGSFQQQLYFQIDRLIADLRMAEKGNRDHHPTPLSSLLVAGCIESGKDLTAGGARYNGSGVQGVGVADVADSLAALDHLVFRRKRLRLTEVLEALRANFDGCEEVRVKLERAPKFGNDHPLPDGYAARVVQMFHDSLVRHRNTRGGTYVPGFYSVTCHVAFGKKTGALPSARRAGEPFASSLGPAVGAERRGPTALLQSVAKVDSALMPNGNALNLRFDPAQLEGDRGIERLQGLIRGFFEQNGMQVQLNVIDPELLEDARAHPGKHPELVVRVAGYCAYFDDLPEAAKDEIIRRTRLRAC
ncbi:MAG: pyruvate formate lyase family protein [bacterium]